MQTSEITELGKTKTYTEIAKICGKTPRNMYMYLTRHNIAFLREEKNRSKTSDGIIKCRKRKRTSGILEYWLSVKTGNGKGYLYHDWLSMPEIIRDVPECNLSIETARNRVNKVINGASEYKSLWEAITATSTAGKKPTVNLNADWGLLDRLWI